MNHRDSELAQLLDLEVDGALSPEERARLTSALAGDAAAAAERNRLHALHRSLAEVRLAARPDFRAGVAAAVATAPAPAWRASGVAGWRWAMALLAALVASSSLLMGAAASRVESGFGVISALGDFLLAAALSGAGLIGASWRGLGLAIGEVFTVPELATLGLGVLALDLFLIVQLRRGRRRAAEAADRR